MLTIGRGATLPFMTIYLSRQYSLSVDLIGYAMTIALTIGVVISEWHSAYQSAAFLAVYHLSVSDRCCVGADVKRNSCKTVGAARALLI